MAKQKQGVTKPPKPGAKDIVHIGIKAIISAFPYLGGPAAEIFAAVFAPPISKRRDEWIESWIERLVELEKKVEGFSVKALSQDERFITTVMHASQVAIRNHQLDKLQALRNAVLNAALGRAPEEDLQLMFLDMVDTFTPWHMKILWFFNDPTKYIQENKINANIAMGSPVSLLVIAFPELGKDREFYDQILNDLYLKGLVNTTKESFHTMMTTQGIFSPRTKEMGKKFIRFITEPPELTP